MLSEYFVVVRSLVALGCCDKRPKKGVRVGWDGWMQGGRDQIRLRACWDTYTRRMRDGSSKVWARRLVELRHLIKYFTMF